MTAKQYLKDNYEELKDEAMQGLIDELWSEQIAKRRLDRHPWELEKAIEQIAQEHIGAVKNLDTYISSCI